MTVLLFHSYIINYQIAEVLLAGTHNTGLTIDILNVLFSFPMLSISFPNFLALSDTCFMSFTYYFTSFSFTHHQIESKLNSMSENIINFRVT